MHRTPPYPVAPPSTHTQLRSRWATAFSQEEFLRWDTSFFNITAKLSKNTFPAQLAALHIAYLALEDAGIPLHDIHRTRTGTRACCA